MMGAAPGGRRRTRRGGPDHGQLQTDRREGGRGPARAPRARGRPRGQGARCGADHRQPLGDQRGRGRASPRPRLGGPRRRADAVARAVRPPLRRVGRDGGDRLAGLRPHGAGRRRRARRRRLRSLRARDPAPDAVRGRGLAGRGGARGPQRGRRGPRRRSPARPDGTGEPCERRRPTTRRGASRPWRDCRCARWPTAARTAPRSPRASTPSGPRSTRPRRASRRRRHPPTPDVAGDGRTVAVDATGETRQRRS